MEAFAPSLLDLEQHHAADELIRLYRYCIDKRGGRQMPPRAEINPLVFSFAIGRVSLVDVVAGPRRFHFGLVSTAITNRLGYELTNKLTRPDRFNCVASTISTPAPETDIEATCCWCPIRHRSVGGAVMAHRRNHDAVYSGQTADRNRRKLMRGHSQF
jgi:hypothetical protein